MIVRRWRWKATRGKLLVKMFADSPLLPYLMSPLRMTSILRDGCFLIVTDSPLLLCSASSLRVTSRSRGYSSKNDICSLIVRGSLLPPVSLCRDLQVVNSIPAVRCRPFGSVRSHCVMGSLPADTRSPFGSVRSLCVTLLPAAGSLSAVTTRRMTAIITVTTADDVGALLQIHIGRLADCLLSPRSLSPRSLSPRSLSLLPRSAFSLSPLLSRSASSVSPLLSRSASSLFGSRQEGSSYALAVSSNAISMSSLDFTASVWACSS